MNTQWDHLVLSSFILYLNNKILNRGQAYTNTSSLFYPLNQTINGYYTYAAPMNQFVSDFSISGAQIPTGIYVNGVFTLKGQNNFVGFNYEKGQAYFTAPVNGTISGNYAVKDVNIVLPNIPHLHFLLDTKFNLRPKGGQVVTGVNNSELDYPAMFIRQFGGDNVPYALGGLNETNTKIGAYIFADSQYLLDGVCSLLKDLYLDYVPLIDITEMPYNYLGDYSNGNYNYINLAGTRVSVGSGLLIKELVVTDFTRRIYSQIEGLTTNAFFATIDFTLVKDRKTL